MYVGRPVRRSFGDSQQLAYRTVGRNRIGGRHERDQFEASVLISRETASQIVIRLLLILVLIQSIGRGLPCIKYRARDWSVGLKVEYSPRDSDAGSRRIITYVGGSSFAQGGVGTKEWPHQRKSNRLPGSIMIERFDELTHSDDVGQQEELISFRACFCRHAFHEVPGKLEFLVRHLHLFDA